MTALSRSKRVAAILALLALCAGPVPAQRAADKSAAGKSAADTSAAGRSPPGGAVVVASGGYRLTARMLDEARRYGQILAAADFSAGDAAALRAGLIATFRKEPARQAAAYDAVEKILQQGLPDGAPSWHALALLRYRQWQWYGQAQRLADFASYPFGRMVLKYNPVVVRSGGMIVTRDNVDCLFYADTLVAKAAAVAPPIAADKDRFVGDLPSRFAAMPMRQRQDLSQAEIRLARLEAVYDGTVKTHAAMVADIRKAVHAPADVRREARRVENDAAPAGEQIDAAPSQALDDEQRLAAMQLQFQMKLDAAKAAAGAALALGNGTAQVPRQAVPQAAGLGAPGRYWRIFIEEAAAAHKRPLNGSAKGSAKGSANGSRADGVASLRELIARERAAR